MATTTSSSFRGDVMPTLANTLRKCHSTVRELKNNWVAIPWFQSLSRASRAIVATNGLRRRGRPPVVPRPLASAGVDPFSSRRSMPPARRAERHAW